MEYTANAQVKEAMQRAHAERGAVLKSLFATLFRSRKSGVLAPQVSRWA